MFTQEVSYTFTESVDPGDSRKIVLTFGYGEKAAFIWMNVQVFKNWIPVCNYTLYSNLKPDLLLDFKAVMHSEKQVAELFAEKLFNELCADEISTKYFPNRNK